MNRGQTVLLACEISPSSFSGERVFRITLANNTEYVGVAPIDYCRRQDRATVGSNEPAKGTRISGFVEGRVLNNGGPEARVALPDGEVITVPFDRISFVSEPKETIYVPVGS
ncbi:MAG: hypothetical protein ACHQ50_12690 [Fimbriimonadales bacterium]